MRQASTLLDCFGLAAGVETTLRGIGRLRSDRRARAWLLAFVRVDELTGEVATVGGSAEVVCVPVVVFFAVAAEGEVRAAPLAEGAAIPVGAVVVVGAT